MPGKLAITRHTPRQYRQTAPGSRPFHGGAPFSPPNPDQTRSHGARWGSSPQTDIRLSGASSSPAENGDREGSAAASLGRQTGADNSMNQKADDRKRTVAERRERIRRELVALGLRPREAEARASIAQMRLSDFQRGGATPA